MIFYSQESEIRPAKLGDSRGGNKLIFKSRYFCGGSVLSLVLALGAAGTASAQSAATTVEEVVVTGSFIAGSSEKAAQPVDVIGTQELAKQGSPSVVQLVKTLTSAQSSLGDSDRYNTRPHHHHTHLCGVAVLPLTSAFRAAL